MGPRTAVIHMDNGRRIEFDVQNVIIEQEHGMSDFARLYGSSFYPEPSFARVEVTGIIRNLIEKDNNMCERSCGYDGECESKGDSLSTKYNNLDLDNNTKKLRKHGLVRLDGTLTDRGKDFLLNILLENNEDEIVEALDAIEEAEKEEKKSCE